MKKIIYILFLLPLLTMGQIVPFGFMETEDAIGNTTLPTIGAITVINAEGTAGTSLAVNKPTGATSGKVAIVFGWTDATSTNTQFDDSTLKPTDFTLIAYVNAGTNGVHAAAWYKVLDGLEGSTFTINALDSEILAASCVILDDVNVSDVVDIVGASNSYGNSSSHIAAGITTDEDYTLAFYVAGSDGSDMGPYSISGTGWVEQQEACGNCNRLAGVGGVWGTKDMATAGATGDATIGFSGSDGAGTFQFSINGN